MNESGELMSLSEIDDGSLDQPETISEKLNLGNEARLRERYLQEYRPKYYQELIASGQIEAHLMQTQEATNSMSDRLTAQYLERFPDSTRTMAEAYAREVTTHEIISSGEPEPEEEPEEELSEEEKFEQEEEIRFLLETRHI